MAEPMMKAVPIPFPEAFVPNPRYYRDPLYFVSEKSTPKDLVPYHDHNFIQLWYVVQGSFMHECGGIRFLHTAGDLLVVPPFSPICSTAGIARSLSAITANSPSGF